MSDQELWTEIHVDGPDDDKAYLYENDYSDQKPPSPISEEPPPNVKEELEEPDTDITGDDEQWFVFEWPSSGSRPTKRSSAKGKTSGKKCSKKPTRWQSLSKRNLELCRYRCEVCGKRFGQKCNLQRHHRLHTGERPHQCPDCGKTFSHVANLTVHRRIHTGEQPYRCQDCDRRFRDKSHLVRHRRTHTGEKPYRCTQCGARFSRRDHLVQHHRTHRKGGL